VSLCDPAAVTHNTRLNAQSCVKLVLGARPSPPVFSFAEASGTEVGKRSVRLRWAAEQSVFEERDENEPPPALRIKPAPRKGCLKPVRS
jgi:hypothetical protein